MPRPSPEDLLSANQSCDLIKARTGRGFDKSSLARAAQLGRIPVALKLPGRSGAYLFRRGDVEAFARERAEAKRREAS